MAKAQRKIIPYDQAAEELSYLLTKIETAKEENSKLKRENRDLTEERERIKNTLKSWKGKLSAAEKLKKSGFKVKLLKHSDFTKTKYKDSFFDSSGNIVIDSIPGLPVEIKENIS